MFGRSASAASGASVPEQVVTMPTGGCVGPLPPLPDGGLLRSPPDQQAPPVAAAASTAKPVNHPRIGWTMPPPGAAGVSINR